MADVVCEEYASSLNDLTFNSKPHISMLTMLAEENIQYAPDIVRLIEAHLQKVRSEIKLPAIYLIDSIVKNIRGEYLSLFTQNLVSTFCSVFEKVDEKTRLQLYKLRQTWMDVFPNKKLYAIDVRVRQMDPAWPISAQASIHVNPKFLKSPTEVEPPVVNSNNQEVQEAEMRKQLIAKQQELIRLQQQKLELELLHAKTKYEEQKRLLQHQPSDVEGIEDLKKLEMDVKQSMSGIAVSTSISAPQIQPQPALAKDPRQPRDPRMLRENKMFRIPNLSSTVTKPINNFGGSKTMDTQIKTELKQSANLVKPGPRSLGGDTPKQTFLLPKERLARNDFKGLKNVKKEFVIPSKSSTKKKGANELKKSKNEQKKKVGSVSPKKSPELKKSEGSKESPEKRKNSDKKTKKVENREAVDSKSRKSSDRKNSSNSSRCGSTKKDHNLKKTDSMGRRATFRSRRNYRSNRDRSESPDKLESTSSPKLVTLELTPDAKKGVEREGRGRSRSPLRKDLKHKKKLTQLDDKIKMEGGIQNDAGKENKMDIGEGVATDVDLRVALDSPTPKIRPKGKREPKENAETDEPPVKRSRRGSDDEDEGPLNNLFGAKDQDYRQIPQGEKSHLRGERNSWAQYKADHPDEFKKSPHPLRGNRQEFPQFRTYDMDFRMARDFENDAGQTDQNLMEPNNKLGSKFSGVGMRNRRGMRASNDPRLSRRGFGRPMRQTNRNFDDSRMLRRHPLYDRHCSEFENSHPAMNIPNALLFDRHADILREADQQVKSGLMTPEEYQELLTQLGKLYELQLTREKQREEQFRERIMSQRQMDTDPRKAYSYPEFENKNFYGGSNRFNISPKYPESNVVSGEERNETEKQQEEESATRTKVSMLSIFQRGNHEVVVDDNPDKVSSAADDGDRFIAIDGKVMKLKYFGCVAVILEGTKPQEILFRGTRREIFVDGDIVLLGFEGDEQTFYVKDKPHTMKFGTPTHEIYIDNVPYEARFGGPAIKVMLDNEPHEIRLGNPPPDVELKELSADMKAEVEKYLKENQGEEKSEVPSLQDSSVSSNKVDDEKKGNVLDKEGLSVVDDSSDKREVCVNNATIMSSSGEIDIEETSKDQEVTKAESPKPVTSSEGQTASSEVTTTKSVDKDGDRVTYQENQGTEERSRDFRQKVEDKERENVEIQLREHHRDKGREKWTNDQWRRGDRLQLRDYNICNPVDNQHDRDEYWNRREDEFARRKYGRERGTGRNGSPQRNLPDYGRYGRDPMRRELPMYYPVNNNRMDGPMMRFDMIRQPYDTRNRFEVGGGWPRYDVRPRADMRHPSNLRQPQFFPGGQADVRRPGFMGKQFDYYSENKFKGETSSEMTPSTTQLISSFSGPSTSSATTSATMDVNELLKKLMAAGILPGSASATESTEETKEKVVVNEDSQPEVTQDDDQMFEQEDFDEKIPTIEFTSECLRTRFDAIIGKLCRGIQCSSCGLRFTSQQTEKYAQHLDWHFRQNRRDRDSAKKAVSRKWYYDVQDWVQFEEIEDMEGRARSMFEEQAIEDTNDQLDDVQSIPVAENEEDNICAVCGESFEQFWDEEKEEWHLRDATRIDNKTYHPICYEDIRNISLMESAPESEEKEKSKTTPTDWKSMEDKPEIDLKPIIEPKETLVRIKEEPMDVDIIDKKEIPAVEFSTIDVIKREPLSPSENENREESRVEILPTNDNDGKARVKEEKDGEMKCETLLPIKDEKIVDNVESQSSQSIDETNVDGVVTLKENNDEMNTVFENLVDATNVVKQTEAPQAASTSSQGSNGLEDDAHLMSNDTPGFLVLPPVMRGTELSGLCSIM